MKLTLLITLFIGISGAALAESSQDSTADTVLNSLLQDRSSRRIKLKDLADEENALVQIQAKASSTNETETFNNKDKNETKD